MPLLKGVVEGRKKLHIFVNVKKENLDRLLASMPALKKPTISSLSEEGWYGVNTIIDKNEFIQIVPIMRRLAQGLVVMDPRQILPLDEINLDNDSDDTQILIKSIIIKDAKSDAAKMRKRTTNTLMCKSGI